MKFFDKSTRGKPKSDNKIVFGRNRTPSPFAGGGHGLLAVVVAGFGLGAVVIEA